MATAVSNSGTSMRWPRPVRPRATRAASTAWAAYMPAMMSTSDTPVRMGGPSGSPVSDMKPLSPCATGS